MYEINQINNILHTLQDNGSQDQTITSVRNLVNEIVENGIEGNSSLSDGEIGLDIRGNCIDINELNFECGYSVSIGRLRLFTDTDEEEICRYLELAKQFARREEHQYIDHLIDLMN